MKQEPDLMLEYIKEKHCVLLDYPDISRMDEIEKKYEDNLLLPTKGLWWRLTPDQKLDIMEKNILMWEEAPDDLRYKVLRAREDRELFAWIREGLS